MPPQSYNFFGLAPAQQQAPPDPSILALQQFNNPTSPNAQPSQGAGINPQALAKMMMSQQSGQPIASDGLQVGKLYNGGSAYDPSQMGPYQLPWLNGGGNG